MSEDRSGNCEDPQDLSFCYSPLDIEVLRGLEHVRKRPALYLGDTGEKGLHFLIEFLLEGPLALAEQEQVRHVEVRLHSDGACSVSDDGPPIPPEPYSNSEMSLLQVLLTKQHAGWGKHDNLRARKGRWGTDLLTVNALSDHFRAEIHYQGQLYRQDFRKGEAIQPLQSVASCQETGMRFTFRPDPTIFSTTSFDFDLIRSNLFQDSCMHSGLRITLEDERSQAREQFHYADGIKVLFCSQFVGRQPLYSEIVRLSHQEADLRCEIAFAHTPGDDFTIRSYAMGKHTPRGGVHQDAFCDALTRSLSPLLRGAGIRNYNRAKKLLLAGLIGVVAVWVKGPSWDCAGKMRLYHCDNEDSLRETLLHQLRCYWSSHPHVVDAIIRHALGVQSQANEARQRR
jgi:DNA gyrase subunit B